MSRVTPYAVGLCSASVCAESDASPREIEDALNASHPTGISSRWEVAGEPFATGEPNPCPCNDHPESRRHWLLHC